MPVYYQIEAINSLGTGFDNIKVTLNDNIEGASIAYNLADPELDFTDPLLTLDSPFGSSSNVTGFATFYFQSLSGEACIKTIEFTPEITLCPLSDLQAGEEYLTIIVDENLPEENLQVINELDQTVCVKIIP